MICTLPIIAKIHIDPVVNDYMKLTDKETEFLEMERINDIFLFDLSE